MADLQRYTLVSVILVGCLIGSTTSQSQPDTRRATKEVCYDNVGCFNTTPPFDNAGQILPYHPDKIGTQFLFYTRDGPPGNETYFIDYIDMEPLKNSSFDPAKKTKIIVHGFSNDITTEWLYEMKDAFLKKGDMNVVIVVWGPGAVFPNYGQAVANTRLVAEQIRQLVINMVALGIRYEDLHFVGHSLGAHISGYVGQLLKKENVTLARITGMDPAEPDFENHPTGVRLDKQDADFVDVIHTNGAPFKSGGAGMFQPCGDVDFYVNGGELQPDCPNQVSSILSHLSDLFSGHTDEAMTGVSCSHSRSHELFTESINSNNCQFVAYPCSGYKRFQNGECLSCVGEMCGVMGYDSIDYLESHTGMLFLNTRRSKPFCGHHYDVRLNVSSNATSTRGSITVQLNGTWLEEGVSEWLQVTRSNRDPISHKVDVNRVVVTKGIVGVVVSINVQYQKSAGKFDVSTNTLDVESISVESADNGRKFLFCPDKTLYTGRVETFFAVDGKTC